MNGCLLIRTLVLGMALLPGITKGQNEYARTGSYGPSMDGSSTVNNVSNSTISNVPLNEINIHAFRHFRRRFPTISGESWVKSEDGYVVTFTENTLLRQVHYDRRGGFLYSLKYYAGTGLPEDLLTSIKKKYPNEGIGVVTEITDGEKTFYLVKVENGSSVRTLSLCEGKIELLED